jgi:ATP-dependent DNA helicase DinG
VIGIDEVFGPRGLLAKKFPGYEPRPGQVAMARAVDRAFATPDDSEPDSRASLIVEAPTGTGKSVAYLVPAIIHARSSNIRTVVVTANISLQEQLIRKDLPMLRELMPEPFTFAIAKGFNNYLCRLALAEADDSRLNVLDRKDFHTISKWSVDTTSGDLSELPFEPSSGVRRLVTTTSDDCVGAKDCAHGSTCCALAARKTWDGANIVVTNYHLFFADLVVRIATGGDMSVLPEHSAVIFDEAHKAADIARDFFGWRLSEGSCRSAAQLLASRGSNPPPGDPLNEKLQKRIEGHASAFFGDLRRFRDSRDYRARLRRPSSVPWEPLRDALNEASIVYEKAGLGAADNKWRQRLLQTSRSARQMGRRLADAMTLEDETHVFYIGGEEEDRATLEAKIIDPSPALAEHVFERVPTVVLTSATLRDGSSFGLVRSELGVSKDAEELEVPSPFDWSRCLVVVPKMPDTNSRDYPDAVCDRVVEAVAAARGRTLGLFTSRRMLERARDAIRAAGLPYRLLVQGSAPRTKLAQDFREDVSSVLLGNESFWAGLDVPGEALSCVVIDRLPFTTPEDPVLDALSERDSDTFFTWSVPRAILQLKQGVGRLIRASSDRGAVVILDNRLYTKAYGKRFLRALPKGVQFSDDISEIEGALS